MAAKVSGDRGLNFSGGFDISEILANQKKVADGFANLKRAAEESVKYGGSSISGPDFSITDSRNIAASLGDIDKAQIQAVNSTVALISARKGLDGSLLSEDQKLQKLIQSQIELKNSVNHLKSEQADLDKLFKFNAISASEYQKKSAKITVDMAALNGALKGVNTQVKQQSVVIASASGSYTELQARLSSLTASYKALSKQERESSIGVQIQKNIKKLGDELKSIDASLGNNQRKVGSYSDAIKGSLLSVAGALGITFGVTQLISFGKELFGIAQKAEGVGLAFAKIGDKADLENLRRAVKGTVDDLELMSLAVRADKFKIPLDVLAKGLEFSRQRAIDLGKDVDYMVNSFVDGVGRKSTLVLDNLGISASELQQEIRKTGDFAKAVGNIMEREMAKGGIAVDTLADKSGRLATIWQNFKKNISGLFTIGGLDIDRIAAETKNGTIDLDKATYASRLKLIDEQEAKLRKASEDRKKAEIAIEKQRIALSNTTNRTQRESLQLQIKDTEKRIKSAKEQEQIENNIYQAMRKQHSELNDADRIAKGLLSVEELRTKAAEKRSLADQFIVKNKGDEKYVQQLYKESEKLEEQANRLSGKRNSDLESNLKRRHQIQNEIDDLIKASSRKQLSADDAELQSVTDKYEKMRLKAKEFEKETGLKTNLSGLKAAQEAEERALLAKQANNRLKTQLEEEGKLYQQFEEYKTRLGEEGARERFRQNGIYLAEEFTSGEAYVQKLENQLGEMLTIDPTKMTEAQKQALQILTDQINVYYDYRNKKEKDLLDSTLEKTKSYVDQSIELERNFAKEKQALVESGNGTPERIAILQRELDERKKAINQANADEKSGFAKLIEDYDELTRKELIKRLNATKEFYRQQYNLGLLTAKQLADSIAPINAELDKLGNNNAFNRIAESIKRYKDALKDANGDKNAMGVKKAQKELTDSIIEGANQINEALADIASTLDKLGIGGEELQKAFKNVSGIVSGAAQIAKGDPVSIITGSIKVLSSAIDLFNNKDAKLQKKINAYKDQLESLGKSYKQLERDVSNAVGDNVYDAQKQQIENLKKQQQLIIQQREAESKKKKADKGKINEYNTALEDINFKIEDISKTINESLIQTNFSELSNNLADALLEAFKAGEDGAKAFDDVFKNVIGNAIKNSLKLKLLQPIIDKFTNDLANYAKNNDNSVLGFNFEDYVPDLKKAGDAFFEAIKGAEQYFNIDSGKAEGLKGKLQRELTETTASEFLGVTRNIYEIQVKQLGVMSSTLDYARSGVEQLELIQANTANTVLRLQDTVSRLDQVVTNTKPDQTARDLGL